MAAIVVWSVGPFLWQVVASFQPDIGIANFTELYYIPWGDVAAASVVVTIPLVALVLVFQRRIVDGLTARAVKD